MANARKYGLQSTRSIKACRDIWPRKMKKQRPREIVTPKHVAAMERKKEAQTDAV